MSLPPRGQNGSGSVHISPPEGAKEEPMSESVEEAVGSLSLVDFSSGGYNKSPHIRLRSHHH